MSTTTTTIATEIATPQTKIISMATTAMLPRDCCPGCGYTLPHLSASQDHDQSEEAQVATARVAELEAQVKLLSSKATAAVDRWADYEDEIAKLREMNGQLRGEGASPAFSQSQDQAKQQVLSSEHTSPEPTSPATARQSFLQSSSNRLSQLLSARKSTPNLHEGLASSPFPSPLSDPHTQSLAAALSREKSLRKEAEGKLNATSREVEELSVTLFEQANEMVASERRARFALEERVGELEKRDKEKGRRLERLEKAMSRIERVRELLKEP